MKKLRPLLLLCLLFSTFMHLQAQERRGFYVDYSQGYSNEQASNHFALFTPGVGWKFNQTWSAGVRVNIPGHNDGYNYAITPYCRFSFLRAGNLSMYTEGMAIFNDISLYYDGDPQPTHHDVEGGLNLGLAYQISNRVSVNLRGLFLGYSDTMIAHEGAVVGGGSFVLDANWRRVALGVQVQL